MTRRSRAALVAVATAVVMLVSGCTGKEPVPTVDGLSEKIEEVARTRQTVPLNSLTDFDWDGVFCFYEGLTNDAINSAVGGEVLEPGGAAMMSGALAVFVKDGKPVRQALIPELTFEIKRYSHNVLVVRGSELTEPDP